MRSLLLLLLWAAIASAATTPNSAITCQKWHDEATEIISATADCTAPDQPFGCCTGSTTGTSCNTTAISTLAAPVWTSVFTAGADGSKVTSLQVMSSDATSHDIICTVKRTGPPKTRAGGVTVSTGTTLPGFATGVPAINLFAGTNWPGLQYDGTGTPYIILGSGDTIDCRIAVGTKTAGKLTGIWASGCDLS